MNILQREDHKSFSKPAATVDHLPVAPFTVTNLDPVNVNNNKKLFYSWFNSQVVAEIIRNILTDSEY